MSTKQIATHMFSRLKHSHLPFQKPRHQKINRHEPDNGFGLYCRVESPKFFFCYLVICKQILKLCKIHFDDFVSVIRDLRSFADGSCETKTNEDLCTLPNFFYFSDFIGTEFLAADRALSASVSEYVQLGAFFALWTENMPGSVPLGRTNFVLEVRQKRICNDVPRSKLTGYLRSYHENKVGCS